MSENFADDSCIVFDDLEITLLAWLHPVAERNGATIREAALGTSLEIGGDAFGGLTSLKLRDVGDRVDHHLACRGRCVELLAETLEFAAVGPHQLPHFGEVLDRTRKPRQIGDHHHGDLAVDDGFEEPLKFRAIGILAGFRPVDEDLDDLAEGALHVL